MISWIGSGVSAGDENRIEGEGTDGVPRKMLAATPRGRVRAWWAATVGTPAVATMFRAASPLNGTGGEPCEGNCPRVSGDDVGPGEDLNVPGATAHLDRLLHHSHVFNIKDCSYRLRDLEHAISLRQ